MKLSEPLLTTTVILVTWNWWKWQHAITAARSFFFNSEVKIKWLLWERKVPLWPPSAWVSARRWPARASPSPSPYPLAPPSTSPWPPTSRRSLPQYQPPGQSREKALQHGRGMQGEKENFLKLTSLLQANHTTPHFTFSLGPFPQSHTCCSESLFNCSQLKQLKAAHTTQTPLHFAFSFCLLTPPSNVVVGVVVCKTNLNQLYSSINHYRAIGKYFLKATYISDVVF